jgi:hypothetical protein
MPTTDWSEATRNWRPPAEIAGQGPRAVRPTGMGVFLAVLSLVMFAGAGVLYWFMSRQAAREEALRASLDRNSIETLARVTRHWRTGDKNQTPMLAYEFTYQDRVYHGRSSAPRQQWKVLDVGSALPIRFSPETPEVNHPSGWAVRVMSPYFPLLVAGLFGLAGFLPVAIKRRQTLLLRDGRAAPARVTSLARTKGGYAVRYEYRLPDGTLRTGRGGPTRTPPEVGTIIPVLFDPERPKRSASYPLDLVRVER